MSNYFPRPLAVPVVYFSAEYSGTHWLRISSDLEIIKLRGEVSTARSPIRVRILIVALYTLMTYLCPRHCRVVRTPRALR